MFLPHLREEAIMSFEARTRAGVVLGAGLLLALAVCDDTSNPLGPEVDHPVDPVLAAEGQEIFRFDTFGNEAFWTDVARLHEVIRTAVSPEVALGVGLKVDVDMLPQALRDAIAAGEVDLEDPQTTVALLDLDAVVGVQGTVETVEGEPELTRVGITCALCHSTVDNSFAPGIGSRLDGWPNRDLDVGAIVALSPAIPEEQKAVYNSWGPGMYDARFNFDGINDPAVIPPAFGLRHVRLETYTADDTISYWNAYVAVTQMGGLGVFVDPRLGISVEHTPDLVTPKLPALRHYQHSLETPPGTEFDVAAAARGEEVFTGQARCSTCHIPERAFTDVNRGDLHAPAETGMDPVHASRSITKLYRTTPLRGLWNPPMLDGPYFHDGSAATLDAVIEHYDAVLDLGLTAQQRMDLVEYLKTL